jgi:hypothetical protein
MPVRGLNLGLGEGILDDGEKEEQPEILCPVPAGFELSGDRTQGRFSRALNSAMLSLAKPQSEPDKDGPVPESIGEIGLP